MKNVENYLKSVGKQFVKESVERFEFDFYRSEIIGMMRDDGFGELNWEDLRVNLNRIVSSNTKVKS